MKVWLAGWLRHWATKLDGRKVLTLDKADRYRVEVGYNWVKVTSLVDGTLHVGTPADKPVSFTSYGAGGAGAGGVTRQGFSGASVTGAGGGVGGSVTGRMRINKPNPRQEPRPDGLFAPGGLFGPRIDCECDYWPGITGAHGLITQHAVGCPQRPDTPRCIGGLVDSVEHAQVCPVHKVPVARPAKRADMPDPGQPRRWS